MVSVSLHFGMCSSSIPTRGIILLFNARIHGSTCGLFGTPRFGIISRASKLDILDYKKKKKKKSLITINNSVSFFLVQHDATEGTYEEWARERKRNMKT